MKSEFWTGRRVLITGHTGFVGCWLTMTLLELGAQVTGFSLPAEADSLFARAGVSRRMRSVEGDLRDSEAVRRVLSENEPDTVFHLAAFGFVRECLEDPERTYSTNVGGTLNLLLNAAQTPSVRRMVAVSSDKVYRNEDRKDYAFCESDPLGGLDPYSASKACEDLLIQSCYDAYLKDHGVFCAILRPSNILGGGDHHLQRLIPGLYDRLSHGEEPLLRNPDAVRPWQNVLDAVDACRMSAESGHTGGLEIYNVGPEESDAWTVGQIAAFVGQLYGRDGYTTARESPAVREYAYLRLNSEKIRHKLGWRSARTLEDTLREIYAFSRADNGTNTEALCREQIRRYYRDRETLLRC